MNEQNTSPIAGGQGVGQSQPLLLLARHGETDANDENRVRSWSDPDINEKGRQQILATAQKLQGLPISEILTSDLSRTEQTGQILANQFFAPLDSSRNLRDWNLGEFIGLKTKDVQDEVEGYIRKPNKKVPGGESFNDFTNRWREGLQDLVSRTMANQAPVIGVVHSKNIEVLRQWLAGTNDPTKHFQADTVPPGGVMALAVQNGKLTQVPFSNEHLVKDEG